MSVEYVGLKEINGPLVVLQGVKGASYEEVVEIKVGNNRRLGRIIEMYGNICVVQVFEGTDGLSLTNTVTKLTGEPLKIPLSKEILGRTLNGIGQPIDGFGEIYPEQKRDVNGAPINPCQENTREISSRPGFRRLTDWLRLYAVRNCLFFPQREYLITSWQCR